MTFHVTEKPIPFEGLREQMKALDGYTGFKGKDDNYNKVWADLDPSLQGKPYCAAGDCYLWKHAGHPYVRIDHVWGFSFCPDAVRWAKEHGYWDESGHYEPGDTIFFCWDSSGVAEHTGTVVSDDGHVVHTFECNTSSGEAGSQANGDGCYFRVRPHGAYILGVLKSSRWLVDHPHHKSTPRPPHPHDPVHPTRHNPFHFHPDHLPLQRGSRGEDVKWAQWALAFHGKEIDGDFGPATEKAVRLFQKHRGLTVDGVVGPQTATALSHVTRH